MGELDDYSHVIEDSTYLTSQVILPIYFSYGIIIWLAIAAIWACQCFKSDTQKVRYIIRKKRSKFLQINSFSATKETKA